MGMEGAMPVQQWAVASHGSIPVGFGMTTSHTIESMPQALFGGLTVHAPMRTSLALPQLTTLAPVGGQRRLLIAARVTGSRRLLQEMPYIETGFFADSLVP